MVNILIAIASLTTAIINLVTAVIQLKLASKLAEKG